MTLVAVIDDNSGVRDSMKLLLELAGHEVVTFASATAFLEDHEIRPDRLIVDHHMPEMTGLELAARLQGQEPNIPFMLMTGAITTALTTNAARFGVDVVVPKPFKFGDILKFVAAK